MWTTATSVGSSDCKIWPSPKAIFRIVSLLSLQIVTRFLIANFRIYNQYRNSCRQKQMYSVHWRLKIEFTTTSSSSHRSNMASIDWLSKSGNDLANCAINWGTNFFSFSEPLTAARISSNSFWCYICKTKWTLNDDWQGVSKHVPKIVIAYLTNVFSGT